MPLLLALAVGGGALWWSWRGGEPAICNLLLVTFDTTRADHLGCYGGGAATSPHVDALAEEGVLFERCIAVAPITLPSHASILTGLYPFRHGVRNNTTHYLPERIPTLAGTLAEEGFETGAAIAAVVLDSRYGLDRGFDHYDDDLSGAAESTAIAFKETDAADVTRRALEWLEERGGERWFLWVHYFDPHASYQPPPELATRCGGSRYDGEIAWADEHFGRILAALRRRGQLEDTLVVATADHGESLGEHGESTHTLFIYDATTRVPLVVAHPSLARGKRVAPVVSLVDIVPTVLELLEVPSPGDLDGRSLARCLLGPTVTPEPRPVYSESLAPLLNHGWADLRAVRTEEMRYVRAPRPELYDLASDPLELHDLHATEPERAEPLVRFLAELLPEVEEDSRGIDIAEVDPKLRESLAALGYTWSEDRESGAPAERPDPKDRIEAWERFLLAQRRIVEGAPEEAERLLRELLAESPDSAEVSGALVKALIDQGRRLDALEVLRRSTLSPAIRGRLLVLRAELERELGGDAWRDCLAKAQALEPLDPVPWLRQGEWALADGELDAALDAFEQAARVDAESAEAWAGIGQVRQQEGRLDAALAAYVEARRRDPAAAGVHLRIGALLQRDGRLAEAEESFRAAVEADPALFTARYALGVLYAEEGKIEPARAAFLAACALPEERIDAWRQLVTACRDCGEFEGMRLAAAELLKRETDDYQGLMATATACVKLGRRRDAMEALQRAFVVAPDRVKQRAARDPELGAVFAELGAK